MASDKPGSGNTANIGSIKNIEDIIKGDGVFAKAGEDIFDDYWSNYGRLQVKDKNKDTKQEFQSITLNGIDYHLIPKEVSIGII